MTKYASPGYTLAAGEGLDVWAKGNFVRFFSSTGASDLKVAFDGSNPELLPVGIGLHIPAGFSKIRVINPDAAPATFQIAIGEGNISDDRLNVSGLVNTLEAVSTALATAADVSMLAGAKTPIIAANAGRKAVTITNLNGNAEILRIGDINVAAARGIELPAGQSVTIETEAAVYAWNPGVAAQSVGLMEVLV